MTTIDARIAALALDDRRRTAVHEAGHAVAGIVLGHAIEHASISPGRGFRGIAVPVPRDLPGADAFDASRSALLQRGHRSPDGSCVT